MRILGSFKVLWYSGLSLGFLYFETSPILNALGIEPLSNLVQGNIKLLLILVAAVLLIAIATIFLSGLVVLTGWIAKPRPPLKTRLLMALPVGVLTFLISGILSPLVPIPILPLVIAGLLVWSILRVISAQLVPQQPDLINVDDAEERAVKFWASRNAGDSKPTPLSAVLDGDRWIITLSGRDKMGQLDIDSHTGVVSGWRLSL